MLKYLPSDKAQDARNFTLLQYWLGGSAENLENFLTITRPTCRRPASCQRQIASPSSSRTPASGTPWRHHVRGPEGVPELVRHQARHDSKDAPVVGLVLRDSLGHGDEAHYAATVMDLEARAPR